MDLALRLFSPAGELALLLDEGHAGATETVTDLQLPESGKYTIVVDELAQRAGPYRIQVAVSAEPQYVAGGTLDIGQVVRSQLAGGREQEWRFRAARKNSVFYPAAVY